MQNTAFFGVFLDNLHALPSHNQFPILGLRIGNKVPQRLDPIIVGLHDLFDQILGKWPVITRYSQHGTDVACPDRARQVHQGTIFQEPGGKARIWAKQQCRCAVYHACIQMRNRHGRRTNRSLAVNLGMVLGNQIRVGATQKLPADREPTNAARFRNTRFLQQWQSPTTATDKHKPRLNLTLRIQARILHLDNPAAIYITADIMHLVLGVQCAGWRADQIGKQQARECTKVYIRAAQAAGNCQILPRGAVTHNQRCPLRNLCLILRKLHAGEQRVFAQRLITCLQEGHVFIPPHKAHMWHGG